MDSTTLMESIIFAVALGAWWLSIWSLHVTHGDHNALLRLQLNGIKRITITARMIRDICRVVGATILLLASGWCILLPPDSDLPALILKHAMLFTSLMMLLTILMDAHWRKVIERELDRLDKEQ